MDKVTLLNDGQDADIHVTWEYQQKINRFSILNTVLAEKEEELAVLLRQLEALDDAKGDLQMTLDEEFLELELEDNDNLEDSTSQDATANSTQVIPVKIGSSFFRLSVQEASERIEHKHKNVDDQVQSGKAGIEKLKAEMSDLKKALYDRFGAAIQLEQD